MRALEEEEERDLINGLKRYGRLAVAWNRHGSPVPTWTLTRYGPDAIYNNKVHTRTAERLPLNNTHTTAARHPFKATVYGPFLGLAVRRLSVHISPRLPTERCWCASLWEEEGGALR